jgi:hypothetical protein
MMYCKPDHYLSRIGEFSVTTVEEWTAILELAAKWKFESIKALAIKQLASLASPIDKIVLGRRHHVFDWLSNAYREVCERDAALTLEEANRLGMDDVVKISSFRQDIRRGFGHHNIVSPCVEDLRNAFGLNSAKTNATTGSCASFEVSELNVGYVGSDRWGHSHETLGGSEQAPSCQRSSTLDPQPSREASEEGPVEHLSVAVNKEVDDAYRPWGSSQKASTKKNRFLRT